MGHKYQAVQWNGNKLVYDAYVFAGVVAFVGVFMALGLRPHPTGHTADPVVLMIRGLGAAAFSMLTVVLLIGPLARLSPRFLPFLYNRRHFGVLTFVVSAAHFGLALLWYHGGGGLNPFVSLVVSGQPGDPFPGVVFELFGLGALGVLFVMAATSHDFWNNNLSAPAWKAIHMFVYVAYGLVVVHVAYGFLVTEGAPGLGTLFFAAAGLVAAAHLAAGFAEAAKDGAMPGAARNKGPIGPGWIEIGDPAAIPDKRAVIAPLPGGDRVAVFRDGDDVFAVDNACKHQNGPLGEGCIIDGAVTCPWHGWQYNPRNGVSPPPFVEKIRTYDTRIEQGVLFVAAKPNRAGEASSNATLSSIDRTDGLARTGGTT